MADKAATASTVSRWRGDPAKSAQCEIALREEEEVRAVADTLDLWSDIRASIAIGRHFDRTASAIFERTHE